MHHKRRLAVTLILVIVLIFPTACGGKASGAVSTLDDVKSATVYIRAVGAFVPTQFGATTQVMAGAGTGFIIDPSGIAVTNNHVVTGAALLEVYVGGEDEPRNAKVLGVSECSDLAVIDIEGEDFPYLEWYEGEIKVGMDVYVAGFPLANPEFTLTRGIVAKERYSGETNWASVDHVIEHDAKIDPGNSGGPLVTKDGEVVAVNYSKRAAVPEMGWGEAYFAISAEDAKPVVEKLCEGEDVNSIGINGEAVNNGEGLSGIWVSGVASGSIADKAGIEGGDIILTMEGLPLAIDYTMSHFCDVLRTHDAGDVLSIEVLRYDTGEILEGQLNGRSLETSISFAEPTAPPADQVPAATATLDMPDDWYAFDVVIDDYMAIYASIPTVWNDRYTGAWVDSGENIGSSVWASSDLDDFDNYRAPGVRVQVSNDLAKLGGYIQLLDIYKSFYIDDCDYESRDDFENEDHRGKYDVFEKCGGSGGPYLFIYSMVSKQDSQAYLAIVTIVAYTQADFNALTIFSNPLIVAENLR